MDFGFNWIDVKADLRRTVHNTFAVAALYQDIGSEVIHNVTVRWHTKLTLTGDVAGAGYAEMIDGIDRLIFNKPELVEQSLKLKSDAVITLVDARYNGASFSLTAREQFAGPFEEIWQVTRRS